MTVTPNHDNEPHRETPGHKHRNQPATAESDTHDAWGKQPTAPTPVAGLAFGPSPVTAQSSAEPVVRRFGINDIAKAMPAAPEWVKEWIDPRRWSFNPYWMEHHEKEVNAEKTLPGNYHSTSRHGGANTLGNLYGRTQKGPNGKSKMVNMITGKQDINQYKISSRFATPAWHEYARNVAKREFETQMKGKVKGDFNWNPKAGNKGYPKHKAKGTKNATFYLTFEDTFAGLSVDANNKNGASTPHVRVAVNYTVKGNPKNPQADSAVIGQLFPEPTAGKATNKFKNVPIPYDEIPWFSTEA